MVEVTRNTCAFRQGSQSRSAGRKLGAAVVFRRWACEQVRPGNGRLDPEAKCLWLGLGESPSGGTHGLLFRDPAGKPPYAVLVEGDEKPQLPGYDLRLYRAYTRKP